MMENEQNDFCCSEEQLINFVKELEHYAFCIKKLEFEKMQIEEQLQLHLNHYKDGSETYEVGNYKLTLTTGLNYRLDKVKYQEFKDKINPAFNPVSEVVDYHLNKKVIRDCHEYGTNEDKLILSEFINSSNKKLHVSYKESR